MNGWAIAFIVTMAVRLANSLQNDGEVTRISFLATLFRTTIDAFLLYMAGTFSG